MLGEDPYAGSQQTEMLGTQVSILKNHVSEGTFWLYSSQGLGSGDSNIAKSLAFAL